MVPKVSVISITYNHERYIAQSVASVLDQQAEFGIEYIVSDDCSKDGTRETLQRLTDCHPGRIQLVLRPENLGPARNFRDTYHLANGQYVALLEGDDYWTDPRKLEKQVQLMDANPDCSLCFHTATYVDEFGHPTGVEHPRQKRDRWTLEQIAYENPVQTCSVLLRRDRVPFLPEFFLNLKLGDWPLCILAANKGPLLFVNESMAAYRVHQQGVWTGLALHKRHSAVALMYHKLAAEFSDLRPLMESALAVQVERLSIAGTESVQLRETRTWKVGSMVVRPAIWLRDLIS